MGARVIKGTLSRATTDWLVKYGASGGVSNPSSVGNFAVVDLFNDATDGSSLWLWWLYLQNSGTESIRVFPFNGHTSGFQDGQGRPLNPLLGAPWGHIYYSSEPSHDDPIVNQYETSVNAPVIDYINPPGPLMVIPPGWSCRCVSNQTDFGFIANFYWTVMSENT